MGRFRLTGRLRNGPAGARSQINRLRSGLTASALRTSAYRWLLILVGASITAFAFVSFQVPHNLAAGGISGIAIIIHHFTDWPVGVIFIVLTIPLVAIGFFHLGRWLFVARTFLTAALFSVLVDFFGWYLPQAVETFPLTDDVLLSSIYAGIVGGLGTGLIFRAGSTVGGTGILSRIIQRRTGLPLSNVYMFVDGSVIATAGLVFGWEVALYAFLILFVHGLATDYIMEGPSRIRTATIVTDRPREVEEVLLNELGRGVTSWEVTGGYTKRRRHLIMCTVFRSQVGDLKRVIVAADERAFLTIGVSHEALGEGFIPMRRQRQL